MIMDGLDTLSQVALADQQQLNLSFDTVLGAPSSVGPHGPGPHPATQIRLGGILDSYDALDTPLTTAADVNFNFGNSEIEIEALPITGEYTL